MTCSTCTSLFYYYNGTCISSCPLGTYTGSTSCNSCLSPCSRCSNSATNCTSCDQNYTLDGNSCVQNCSVGIPITSVNGSICSACTDNCSTCSISLNNCTSCTSSSNTSLSGNICVTNCPPSTISINSTCISCLSPCLTCNISQTNCLACQSNFYSITQNGSVKCVSNCSQVDLFNNGTQCVACQSPCSICINTSVTCTSCISDYFLLNNFCYSNCSLGYYAFQGNCIG